MREPYTQLFLHLVWSTWDRLPILSMELRDNIYACLKSECKKLSVTIIAIGGTEDHIHVLVRIPATISVADLVKQLKGSSSHYVNYRSNGKEIFRWQEGYGAFTISKSVGPSVRDYILKQEEHHRDKTTSKDYEFAWEEKEHLNR